jgi:hypothetical protein
VHDPVLLATLFAFLRGEADGAEIRALLAEVYGG